MAWIGWQVGSSGPTVQAAKRKLKAKFSYAKALDDTEFFGPDLEFVLKTYQTAKNMGGYMPVLRADGVLDYATQDALGMIQHLKPVMFTVQGTGVDMWTGYPADLARACLDLVTWQPIGNYPAAPFPMRDSYVQGIAELVLQIRSYATRFPGIKMVLVGYSQGAIVVSRVWKHYIADPNGSLHDLMPQVVLAVTWGNPDRELGKANGNKAAGWPIPDGAGITGDNLMDTPDWWLDFAHGANSAWGRDVYTDTPWDTETGRDMQSIWPIVESVNPSKLLTRLVAIFTNPAPELLSAAMAVYYAGMFFIGNPPTLPHVNYQIEPAVAAVRRALTK